MSSLGPSSAELPAQPGPSVLIASYPFIEGVWADIAITGTITMGSDPRATLHYDGPLDYHGLCVPTQSGAYIDAKVNFSMGSTQWVGGGSTPDCNVPRTMTNLTFRAIIAGDARAVRGPMPVVWTWCGGYCAYSASGSQTVTITPLSGDLNFGAAWNQQSGKVLYIPLSAGTPYLMVHFQEYTNPTGLTLKPLWRTWKQGDPTLAGNRTNMMECVNGNYQGSPPTYPALVCDIWVKESGIMTSLTRVNGVQHTQSVTVYCADTFAILNRDRARQELMTILDSSGVPAVPNTSRKERIFFILKDTTTPNSEPYIFFIPELPHADGCHVGNRQDVPKFSARPAGTKLLAWGHDHVIPFGGLNLCPDDNGIYEKDSATGLLKMWKAKPGISPEDWEYIAARNNSNDTTEYPGGVNDPAWVGPVNHYIINPDGDVYVVRPGQLPGAVLLLEGNNLNWGGGQCAWPRRT